MIPLSVPNLSGREMEYVNDCLKSGWISTSGDFVSRFEQEFATKLKVPDALSLMNGTAALHLALRLIGVGPGDLVVMPNITFVATANSISYMGAEPLLIDIDASSWQMDLSILEAFLAADCHRSTEGELIHGRSGRKVAAVVAVHVQGDMCDMASLVTICSNYQLPLVEDAAEALGSTYKGRAAGTIGDIGCFSFNGNKIMSTGGGGMLVAKNKDTMELGRHLATTAKTDPSRYHHDEVGYNYRMVNVLAAIGVAQLEQLDGFIEAKHAIACRYRALLSGVGDIGFQESPNDVSPNNWLFTITTNEMEHLLHSLNTQGVMCRPFWMPINSLPMYAHCFYASGGDVSSNVHAKALSLPCSTNLPEPDQLFVINKIRKFFGKDNA